MDLYLRKVDHPQARDNYRVILKTEHDGEIQLGSIGMTHFHVEHEDRWHWGIDTVIPMRSHEQEGEGKDRDDCMRQFKAAWEKFAADRSNFDEFVAMKLAGRR